MISGCLWSLGFTCIRKPWLDVLVRKSFPGLLGTLFLQKDVSREHWELPIALLNPHCSYMGTTGSTEMSFGHTEFLCPGRALHQHLHTNFIILFLIIYALYREFGYTNVILVQPDFPV